MKKKLKRKYLLLFFSLLPIISLGDVTDHSDRADRLEILRQERSDLKKKKDEKSEDAVQELMFGALEIVIGTHEIIMRNPSGAVIGIGAGLHQLKQAYKTLKEAGELIEKLELIEREIEKIEAEYDRMREYGGASADREY